MEQLIDKFAVIAEIKKLDEFWHLSKSAGGQAFIESLLSFLDTLETKEEILNKEDKTKLMKKCVHKAYKRGYDMGVLLTTNKMNHNMKEVDLEKEVEDWVKTGPHTSYPWCTIPDAIRITAEHFYELGLKKRLCQLKKIKRRKKD